MMGRDGRTDGEPLLMLFEPADDCVCGLEAHLGQAVSRSSHSGDVNDDDDTVESAGSFRQRKATRRSERRRNQVQARD